jgi:hypothetical protein
VKIRSQLPHRFVEFVPESLEDGILYVSLTYATASHRCCCGCGREVVTPLSPTDWKMIFDGENVSLHPSIGNWEFPCRSHYWIREGRVQWVMASSDPQIGAATADQDAEKAHFHGEQKESNSGPHTVRTKWLPAFTRRWFHHK